MMKKAAFIAAILVFIACISSAWSAISIYSAAEKGDVNQVKAILDRKPDLVNSKGQFGLTPLHYAAMKNQLAVAELLISRKADVNARNNNGQTHLCTAPASEDTTTWLSCSCPAGLILLPAPIPASLHFAVAYGKDTVNLLITYNADVNAQDTAGDTPLHKAAFFGRKDIAEVLITNGADINARDKKGDTPLRVAIAQGRKEVADFLVSKGAKE